ncbi:MAG: nucleotide exchange factor GrpE [Chloroflexota bacterium]
MTEEQVKVSDSDSDTNSEASSPAEEQLDTHSGEGNSNTSSDETDVSLQLETLQKRIAELEKEAEENKNNWLRAAADYKNFKRRVDQERSDLISRASSALLLKLLPIADDIDRAVDSVTPEVAESSWYGGFKLIPQKLQTVLESEGVTPIDAVGQEFDPNWHEAVMFDDSGDGETTHVVAELQKGYKLRDRVLRPTMVKVGNWEPPRDEPPAAES